MFFKRLKSIFDSHHVSEQVLREPLRIKVLVMAFDDDCPENSGKILAQYLSGVDFFEVQYCENQVTENFTRLNGQNFFDFIEDGKQILHKAKADILVRGLRTEDKICLSFQTIRQYDKRSFPFFSLSNNLYLPLPYLQEHILPEAMLSLIKAMITAMAEVKTSEVRNEKLKEIIAEINRQRSPRGLSLFYMPYFLNVLSLIYLQASAETLKLNDVKMISMLLENARKYQSATKDMLLLGNIYANFGQLYQCAAKKLNRHKYIFYKNAAECCRYAQKYFNRYTYPYDFGMLAYRLSQIYYGYWKQSSDIQALRDAVFHLREAEKIFTGAVFPYFWAEIQGDLGLYLSLLGLFSANDEISMLAVDNYKKWQQVYVKEEYPLEWAKAEASIGNIFYNSGKKHNDEEYLEESIKYYDRAAEIYENGKLGAELKQMQICVAKADEYIMQLNRK